MGLFERLRGRSAHRSVHVIGRITDDPQFVSQNGTNQMVFHVTEVPETEFRITMLPTTPKRRKGERVELVYQVREDHIAWVETMNAAPDAEATRVRNQEYLASIQASQAKHE
ncbi:MAG TPA: hypothetical protein VGZ23_13840 [bacterium]|nr:hypothetical protein [bacterium]